MCSQLPPMPATYCKKLDSINIYREHCHIDFVAEHAPGYTCDFLFHNHCKIKKKCCAAPVNRNVIKLDSHLLVKESYRDEFVSS